MSHFVQTLVAAGAHQNHEGFPTFVHSDRDQVRNFLRTGTLSGTFYVSAPQLARETIETLVRFGRQDAQALADEAIAARNDGFMRTLPIVALAVLSGLPDKSAFKRAAPAILRIPRDVAQFVTICKSGSIPGVKSFGGCRVRPVRQFLEVLSQYHAVKGTQDRSMQLRDLVRLAHPRPATGEQRELLGWLSGHVKGSKVTANEQVKALEALKREHDPARQVELIRQGRLPYEAVVAAVAKPGREVWAELLRQAPTFNLLRNLRTFGRHGVFEDSASVTLAVDKLTRPGALRKAKVLPFRAYQAWKAYSAEQGADPRIIAALSDALEESVVNLPLFEGRVCLAPDVSGSMGSYVVGGKSESWSYEIRPDQITCSEVSGIFAAGLLKQCPDVRVLPFEGRVVDVSLNPRDSVLSNAQKIASLTGGSTCVAAPVERLLRDRDKVDLFVGLTDNEEWVRDSWGRSFIDVWRQYKREVAPAAKAVLITVVPTKHRVAPESEDDVYFVHGWSDSVLRYVAEVSGLCSVETGA